MKKNLSNKKQRTAFSLIELSIVLIIIGLLVAGVTGGASLIKNASLRGVMSDARNYGISINSFYVQYSAYPGDYTTGFSSTTPANAGGNNNGQIDFINGATTNISESNLVWQHLKASGIIDTPFSPGDATVTTTSSTSITALVPGTKIPKGKAPGSGWIVDNITISTLQANWLILTAPITAVATAVTAGTDVVPVAVLTPTDASSIDDKVDDGNPSSGSVRSAVNGAATTVSTTCHNTTTNIYALDQSGKNCALAFRVDVI